MMVLSKNSLKHASIESTYWNKQAIEYLLGKNKPFSIDDSIRCFKKSMDLGDEIALYNLAVLTSIGYVGGSLSSNPRIQDFLFEIKTNNENLQNKADVTTDVSPRVNLESNNENGHKSGLELIEEDLRSTSIADVAGIEVIIVTGLAGELRKKAESIAKKHKIKNDKYDEETLAVWINRAKSIGLISNRERDTLNDIREFGNSNVHSDRNAIVANKDQLNKWFSFLIDLEKKLDEGKN